MPEESATVTVGGRTIRILAGSPAFGLLPHLLAISEPAGGAGVHTTAMAAIVGHLEREMEQNQPFTSPAPLQHEGQADSASAGAPPQKGE
jgi:hypothetical protein